MLARRGVVQSGELEFGAQALASNAARRRMVTCGTLPFREKAPPPPPMNSPKEPTSPPEATPHAPIVDDGREQSLQRWLRRAGIAITGTLTLMAGVLMLPLPGPGFPLMLAGLGILALEFAWAAVLLKRLRAIPKEASRIVDENGGRRPRRNIVVGIGKLWRSIVGRAKRANGVDSPQ